MQKPKISQQRLPLWTSQHLGIFLLFREKHLGILLLFRKKHLGIFLKCCIFAATKGYKIWEKKESLNANCMTRCSIGSKREMGTSGYLSTKRNGTSWCLPIGQTSTVFSYKLPPAKAEAYITQLCPLPKIFAKNIANSINIRIFATDNILLLSIGLCKKRIIY